MKHIKRWPLIRHIRWFIYARRVDQHYEFYRSLGMLPSYRSADEDVLEKIWRGEM